MGIEDGRGWQAAPDTTPGCLTRACRCKCPIVRDVLDEGQGLRLDPGPVGKKKGALDARLSQGEGGRILKDGWYISC